MINFRYSLEDRPPLCLMLLYALQWLAVSIPFVIIIGNTVAAIQYPSQPDLFFAYLQKTFFLTGIFLMVQVLAGHRLPLIVGPASVLLLGIATAGASPGAIAGATVIGGVVFTALSSCNASAKVNELFTPRVIGVTLLLIAFTMLPTIIRLLTGNTRAPMTHLLFSFVMLSVMLVGQRVLPSLLKSAMILCSLVIGSLLYYLMTQSWPQVSGGSFLAAWIINAQAMVFDPAVILTFLFCYAALWVNDLGSMQTTAVLVKADRVEKRVRSGLLCTGVASVLAGGLGVIGSVNYSLSTGLILATQCASRITLVPAAAFMMLLAFVPSVIQVFAAVPPVVVGSLLLYMMGSQIAGSFGALQPSFATYQFEDGLIIGIPLLLATVTAFLPPETTTAMPPLLKPLLSNGFVVGGVAVMVLEHVIFRSGH